MSDSPSTQDFEPETTAQQRVREAAAAQFGPVAPAVNVARLQAAVGPERMYAPQRRQMSFRIPKEWLGPKGILPRFWEHYQRLRKDKVAKWFRMVDHEGFDFYNSTTHQLRFSRGFYPAIDTLTGAALLGEAEVTVTGWFTCRKPVVERFELEPDLLEETTPASYAGPERRRAA